MKRILPLISLAAMLLASAAIVRAQPASQGEKDSDAIPPKVAAFSEVVNLCEAYQKKIDLFAWQTVYTADFSKADAPTWQLRDPANQDQAQANPAKFVKTGKEKDHDVLLVDSSELGVGLVAFGPKVSGDFAIEIVGKITSDHLCDLSVICDGFGRGPGFQFGGHDNQRNIIWTTQQNRIPALGPVPYSPLDAPSDVLIKKDTWHRVRLEVRQGKISAIVDGNLLLTTEVGDDAKRDIQPMLYVHQSAATFANLSVQKYIRDEAKIDRDSAWKDVFGDKTTREDITTKLYDLITLLGDPDRAIREATEGQLNRTGEIGIQPLESAAKAHLPEMAKRAQRILTHLKSDAKGS